MIIDTLVNVRSHPAHILLEVTDPSLRLNAHLELGKRAMKRDDLISARTHFEQAFDLDPTDERPKASLRGMAALQPEPMWSMFNFWKK